MRQRLAWSVGWKLLLLAAFATYFIGQEVIGPWIFQ